MTATAYKPPVAYSGEGFRYLYDAETWGADFSPVDSEATANDFVPAENSPLTADRNAAKGNGAVSYFTVTKQTIGFREASRLVSIAENSGSVIKLVAGRTVGTTKSILSIIKMGIKANTSVGLFVVGNGNDTKAVFAECLRVFSGK